MIAMGHVKQAAFYAWKFYIPFVSFWEPLVVWSSKNLLDYSYLLHVARGLAYYNNCHAIHANVNYDPLP